MVSSKRVFHGSSLYFVFLILLSFCLLFPMSTLFADFDGRLPVSQAEPLEPTGAVPENTEKFFDEHGKKFAVY